MSESPTDPALPQSHPASFAAQVEAAELEAQSRIETLWHRVPHSVPAYPTTNENVGILIRSLGYECTEQKFAEFVDRGLIVHPPRIAGRLAWSASSISNLIECLEYHRCWKPGAPQHAWKRNAFERDRDMAEAFGNADSLQATVDAWTLDDLLRLILDASSVEARQAVHSALRIKLRDHLPK